jgi:hypothetical protein
MIKALLIFIFCFGYLEANQTLYLQGKQAEAYALANDFDKAAEIYENILKLDLPEWQKSILLYNLGTVKIHQQQYEVANNLIQKIPKDLISSPWLMRDLEMNEGMISLFEAMDSSNAFGEDSPDLLSQVQASIHLFKVSDALDCLVERLETEDAPLISCTSSPWVVQPLIEAYRLMSQLKQKLMQELSKSEKNALLLLIEGAEQLTKLFQEMKNHSNEFLPYFYYQAKSLMPLWESIPQKSVKDQKKTYDELLTALEKNDIDKGNKLLNVLKNQLEETLGPHLLDSLLLNYQLVLFTEPLTSNKLQNLLSLQKKINLEENQKKSFEQAEKYLEKGLSIYEVGHSNAARFYVAAAMNVLLETVENNKGDDPILVLENALLAQRNSLQLNHLYAISPINVRNPEMEKILKNSQKRVLGSIPLFISAVLKEEKKNFTQKNSKDKCQKTPWNQAIPLFDKGAQEAQEAHELLSKQPPLSESALEQQTSGIKFWKKVLDMLKNPPSPESDSSNQKSESSPTPIQQAPTNPDDTLRLLQEMQLQDQKVEWKMPKEFESW